MDERYTCTSSTAVPVKHRRNPGTILKRKVFCDKSANTYRNPQLRQKFLVKNLSFFGIKAGHLAQLFHTSLSVRRSAVRFPGLSNRTLCPTARYSCKVLHSPRDGPATRYTLLPRKTARTMKIYFGLKIEDEQYKRKNYMPPHKGTD